MKKNNILTILFGCYCAGLIIQNILATKNIEIGLFTVTTGILISPLIFIVQDVTTEIFGYKQSKKMIILGFIMNFIGTILFQIAILIPASTQYQNQEAFSTILSTTLRISIASCLAYIAGSLVNSKIMDKLKEKYSKNLFIRAITSTIFGQFIDNAVFAIGAFYLVLSNTSILTMIIGGTLFEVIYEIIFYPVTKTVIKKIEEVR